MKRFLLVCMLSGLMTAAISYANDMRVRVIQPPYAPEVSGIPSSFDWMLDQLDRCDASLDLIVLPEFSDVPGRTWTRKEYLDAVEADNSRLLAACAATAARCDAVLFVNAIDHVEGGLIRNTTFAFDRSGKCVGKYYKRHVTAGERDDLGFDVSYAGEWSEPYTIVIDGIKYAFETCYDFYFYEMIGPIALQQPDIVIGCSLQRSDKHHALEFINQFCAYNTGAYLVRASVSMGKDATVGGSSMVVAPTGIILGNMKSRVGSLDVTIDPTVKYLKPAGYGNPPATHPSYMEIGRRPWLYRPGGSAIVLPVAEAPTKRICADGGLRSLRGRNPLAAIGAAVALDADEIGLELRITPDGTITYRDCSFEKVLRKFSCHTIMAARLVGEGWDEDSIDRLLHLVSVFDAKDHIYFISSDKDVLSLIKVAAPRIPLCLDGDAEEAAEAGCSMLYLDDPEAALTAAAHDAGLRCVAPGKRRNAARLQALGVDTVIIKDFK